MIWIPSHTGIIGNELADKYAKEAIDLETNPNDITVTSSEFTTFIKRKIRKFWDQEWNSLTDNKLRKIKSSTEKWENPTALTRKQEVIITRLRTGHTNITHKYLMSKDAPSVCVICDMRLSIDHLLTECPLYEPERLATDLAQNLDEILDNSEKNVKKLIEFLHITNLTNKI